MTRTSFLRVRQIGLTVFLVLLVFSCTPISYDFIGTWTRQPETFTYINSDHHIKLTFPNKHWTVFKRPWHNTPWKIPSEEDSSYHILYAMGFAKPGGRMFLLIDPMENENISLADYMAIFEEKLLPENGQKGQSDLKDIDYKVIQRKGRRIAIMTFTVKRGKGFKAFNVSFKEKGRFTTLGFSCFKKWRVSLEDSFESCKNEYWTIVDSYEYLE